MNKEKYPKILAIGTQFGYLTILGVDEDSKIDGKGKLISPSKKNYLKTQY